MLPNVKNIQASWLTVGKQPRSYASMQRQRLRQYHAGRECGQCRRRPHRFTARGIQAAIREAGFDPQLRTSNTSGATFRQQWRELINY